MCLVTHRFRSYAAQPKVLPLSRGRPCGSESRPAADRASTPEQAAASCSALLGSALIANSTQHVHELFPLGLREDRNPEATALNRIIAHDRLDGWKPRARDADLMERIAP